MRSRTLLASLLGPALLAATLACREDPAAPTAPDATPSLATAATQAVAFHQVSGGSAHTCAVATDNRAYCWGWNSGGRLGDGTTTTSRKPVAVASSLRFRRVSAGGSHSCGVTTDNRAYCWGFNGDGALGDGTTTTRLTPVAVAGRAPVPAGRGGGVPHLRSKLPRQPGVLLGVQRFGRTGRWHDQQPTDTGAGRRRTPVPPGE